ncbi:hypothetical protein GCM10010344_01680 [Streptomyces bluensis]|nr:hypothetical protein GCM10010344_01680 [Streptomyces bluensis]
MSELTAGEMRRLKELPGLRFAKLAARTHYSRSTREGFLNGKKACASGGRRAVRLSREEGGGGLLLVEEREPGRSPSFDGGGLEQRSHRWPAPVELFATGGGSGGLILHTEGALGGESGPQAGLDRPAVDRPAEPRLGRGNEAGIEDPVVFEEDPGTSSRLHPLQRPEFRELLTYARPGDTLAAAGESAETGMPDSRAATKSGSAQSESPRSQPSAGRSSNVKYILRQ